MRGGRQGGRHGLWVALLLIAAVAQAQPQSQPRIVAVGDVHGDLDSFTGILQKTGLIDASRRWTGRNAILVQTGDFLDRGPKSREEMDFLMALQKEAQRSGGAVHVLLGNHEAMNIFGDLRYLIPADYAAFADPRSEERRRRAFQEFSRQQASRGRAVNEAEWFAAHPPGFLEHREAFGPRGVYGRWLRSLPSVLIVGDSAFVHGGVSPALQALTPDQINDGVKSEIRAFDSFKQYLIERRLAFPFYTLLELIGVAKAETEAGRAEGAPESAEQDSQHVRLAQAFLRLGEWRSLHPDGPLWFRGYARWTDEEGAPRLAALTESWNVKRVIVGHTVQPNGEIVGRFDGKAFLIDTGMLKEHYAGGQASALEISATGIRAIYMDRQIEFN